MKTIKNPGQTTTAGITGGKKPAGRSIMYEERAPYSSAIKWLFSLGFVVLAFFFISMFSGYRNGSGKVPQQAHLAILLPIVIIAIAMWSFFNMRFRITGSGVEAIMPPFRKSIPFSEIKEVKVIENLPWYTGWGLRMWDRKLAFISMRKSAVEIEKKKGFFKYLILTTRNPEDFVKKLKEQMK